MLGASPFGVCPQRPLAKFYRFALDGFWDRARELKAPEAGG